MRESMIAGRASDAWMQDALHDLCSPLTALECGLYLGSDPQGETEAARLAAMEETVSAALVQCRRLMDQVRAMQHRMSN